jgi:hypothetical protein
MALIELVGVVFVFKMTAISCMAQLTLMSNALTGSHQSCYWDGRASCYAVAVGGVVSNLCVRSRIN